MTHEEKIQRLYDLIGKIDPIIKEISEFRDEDAQGRLLLAAREILLTP